MSSSPFPAAQAGGTASHLITTRLVRDILRGHYGPGDKLPTEREMASQFGVSRHVVREALKRLEALGLIHIQQGSGAYTRDVLLTGGLELFEYLLFDEQGRFDMAVLRDFFSFWLLFVPDVFRLAAARRTSEDVAELREALQRRARALDDLDQFLDANQRIMRAIAKATHNSVYQLVFNNVGRIFLRLRALVPLEQFAPLVPQENLEKMIEAVIAGDPEVAALLAHRETENGQALAESVLAQFSGLFKK